MMKFSFNRSLSQRSYHIYLVIVLQFAHYNGICVCNNQSNDVLIAKQIGSQYGLYLPNIIFGHKIKHNYSLKVMEAILKLQIQKGLVQFSSTKSYSLPHHTIYQYINRMKRKSGRSSKIYSQMKQDVCPSVSDWVARTEAFDPYGNRLTVVQRIPINGTIINQYFYETFCSYNLDNYYDHEYSQSTQCRGVDKKAWNSRCRENYIWTYGMVQTNSEEMGWSVIAIRGSCGCAIWPKHNETGKSRKLTEDQQNKDPFF